MPITSTTHDQLAADLVADAVSVAAMGGDPRVMRGRYIQIKVAAIRCHRWPAVRDAVRAEVGGETLKMLEG